MLVPIWITLEDGADRPYVSTKPPSPERKAELERRARERGHSFTVVRADVEVLGWNVEDRVVRALARKPYR